MESSNRTRIAGSDLVPDFDKQPGLAVEHDYAYWMGLTPKCPENQIDCAGLHFVKQQELLEPDRNKPGSKVRVPVVGALDKHVTFNKIQALRECLPRMVIRWRVEGKDRREEPGTGENIRDVAERVRKGYVITIPTKEQVASAKKEGTRIPHYVRQSDDEPAARYMFFQRCERQDAPDRGKYFNTIEEVGIEWPGEIDEDHEVDDLIGD